MSAFDDYLSASPAQGAGQSFDAYLGGTQPPAQPAPQAVPPVLRAPKVNGDSTAVPQQPWKVPNSFGMGLGEAVGGGVQSLVHGVSALAQKYPTAAKVINFMTGGDLNADVAGDFANGAKQVDATLAQHDKAYAATRAPNSGVDWGRLGGNLAGNAPLALLTPEIPGLGLVGRTALGAGMGGFSSLFTPVTDASKPYADQKATQIGIGALTGGAAVPITSAIGGAVSGVTDAARRRLADAGVTMTPGQILGGAWQRTEDKLSSVPVLGDMIKNAQQRSVQSFNRATYQGALDPIGGALPRNIGAGSDGVAYVRGQIGNVYNSIEPRAQFVADQNFSTDLSGIRNNLAQAAPNALPQFDNIVQNQVTGKLSNGAMTGAQWGDTRSMIDRFARTQIKGDASADQWALNGALGELNDAVNAAVGRASPPDVLPMLGRANAAYAQYKQLERAAGALGARNNGNIFTPGQYSNAVGSGATSFQKATNSGLNGQLAEDAMGVLGSKYPDSGTVGRSLLTLGLGAMAGHSVVPQAMVPAGAAIGLGSLPYTSLGQRLTQGLLMSRPAVAGPLGQFVRDYGPALGLGLAPAAARAQP